MQQFFNVGLPTPVPERGLAPAQFVRNMSIPVPIGQYNVVQLKPSVLESDTLAWNTMIPLRPQESATIQDTDIYGITLDAITATNGGYARIGFYGDFTVKCGSGISANGMCLVANTTNNATSDSASSSAHSNWLIVMGSINTTQTTANHVTAPFDGQKVLGYVISSNATSNTTGLTQLVRFNGFGWGNGAF